jgi:UDP-glucose 4-epimerase
MSAKRVLITGGTGFVGANLARKLLAEGHEVHLLVRQGYSSWRIADIISDVAWHVVNLGDPEIINPVVQDLAPDWVFHLAAHGAYPTQQNLDQMIQTNVISTVNLIQACLKPGVESFIYGGSSSEYGLKDHPSLEDERLDPNSLYAVTKASASLFCQYYAHAHQFPILVARLYSIFGPYEEPSRLIPTLVIHGLFNRLPPLVHPNIARDFVYVDDACQALLALAKSKEIMPGEIFNISSGKQTTIRELVDIIKTIFTIEDEPDWGTYPERQWDTGIWHGSFLKINQAVGWRPTCTIADGIQKMICWLAEHPNLKLDYQQKIMGVNKA